MTLAEELHFRRAAERMHIAQPAFSGQIRRLESDVGVQLFERTSHYVRLTEAGRLFLDEVRRALAQVDRAAAVAAQAGRGELGSLTVGFIGSAANELTPLILRAFADRYPTVDVTVREFDFRDPSAGLAGSHVDVAFMRPPVECQHDLVLETLLEESRVAVMASDHHLAEQPVVSLRRLLAEPFVVGPCTTGRASWLAIQAGAGTPPREGPEVNTVDEWLQMLAAGQGVSLAPASSERFHARPGVSFVPVSGAAASTVAIARRKGPPSPVVSAFVGVARQVAHGSASSNGHR